MWARTGRLGTRTTPSGADAPGPSRPPPPAWGLPSSVSMPQAPSATRLALVALALLAGCSGLPPETLTPLQGGETAVGITVAADLGRLTSPEVGGWFGLGLGRGVDAAIGFDIPLGFVFAGPYAVRAPTLGMLPGLSLRKSFDNGLGVGIGSSSRHLFSARDTTGSIPHVATAGVFVTTVSPSDQTLLGRATLHVGYAEVIEPNALVARRGLAVHAAGQAGVGIAMADTARAVVALRAQAGMFVWPGRGRVQGPSLGLTGQIVDFNE